MHNVFAICGFIFKSGMSKTLTSQFFRVSKRSCILSDTAFVHLYLRWFSLEQHVDLKAEGLWDQLLDEFQPEIVIEDW